MSRMKVKSQVVQGNLMVFPLFAESNVETDAPRVMSSRQALRQNVLRLRESSRVDWAIVEVTDDVLVLLPEYEVLEGGGQNRTLATPALLGRGEHRLPVRCVERSRWQPDPDRAFQTAEFGLPLRVRQAKYRTGFQMWERAGNFAPDQGRIWEAIAHSLRRSQAESPTESVSALYTKRRREVEAILRYFPPLPGQVGAAIFYNGHLLGVELLASPELWREYHDALLRSYLLSKPEGAFSEMRPLSFQEVHELLDSLHERIRPLQEAPAGKGRLVAVDHPLLQGIGLEYESRLYTLSALPVAG